MTSTFVNDLRLNEMATGDQSGSWGTVTNTNLELIGEALGYGTEGITTNANTHTSTIADGATDPVRALYVEYTGTLDSACTVTIAPNTVNKVCFIENGTSGSQNIIIKQGSGATITIPAGQTKAVYLDGAGSGAKVVDAFASLSVVDLLVDDDLTVTDDAAIGGLLTVTGGALLNGTTPTLTIGDAGAEDAKIVFDGNAVDYHVGLDDSEDALQIGLGAALGTTPRITIRAAEVVVNDLGIDLNFRVESSNTAHLLFTDGGEDVVGIGTPTPVPSDAVYKRAALHIHQEQGGSHGSQIHMTNDATGAAAGNGMFIAMWQDDDVYFTNQESDGNIKFSTGGNANVLVLNENGSLSTSTAGSNNTRFGLNAGDAIASGGVQNVCIGDDAGTTISTGDNNVLVGFQAGDALLLGSNNIAIGKNSLGAEDGHSHNIAIGSNSLATLNAGVDAYNIAIGSNAGTLIEAGNKNVAIGGLALDAEVDGNRTVAIGYQAFSGLSSASSVNVYNVAVGFDAGKNATSSIQSAYVGGLSGGLGIITGNNNACFGYNSGYDLTSGNADTLLGAFAGYNLTTGQENVAVGTSALFADVDGNKSTAIGRNALTAQTGTDGDMNNVAVGYGAGGGNQTGNNNVLVGALTGDAFTTGSRNTMLGTSAGGALVGANSDNTFMGCSAGENITSGDANTIVGRYNGSQDGLDIRTASNNIVLSDGDGVIGLHINAQGAAHFHGVASDGVRLQVSRADSDGAGAVINATNSDAANSGNIALQTSLAGTNQNNTNCAHLKSTTQNVASFQLSGNGASSFTSDSRLKKNIETTRDGYLEDLDRLRVVKYNWHCDEEGYQKELGLIAQEVQQVFPGMVHVNNETLNGIDDTLMLKTSVLPMMLLKAVQELSAKNDALEARIAVLEG